MRTGRVRGWGVALNLLAITLAGFALAPALAASLSDVAFSAKGAIAQAVGALALICGPLGDDLLMERSAWVRRRRPSHIDARRQMKGFPMKLASFTAGRAPELGVVEDGRIISLSRAAPGLADDMIALIARWGQVQPEVKAVVAEAAHVFSHSAVRLLAPIQRPGKIMAIGLNYSSHVEESQTERPANQIWFSKAPTAVNGPFDPVVLPRSASTDYEAELVVVIGSGGRQLDKAAAPDAVFGYCVGNDVSERKWQMLTPQWTLGKSFDTHAPIGPWITTADEVQDPHNLPIRCLVNGELRQSSNTSKLMFDIGDQVEYLSRVMTLEPGDLIFTGTPGGVGVAMKPPRFLLPGDRMRVEIDGLGAIEARCEAQV
jgi:2-keto-4-pentenoate hydratase/2-oxohepta-3-ene-1,7-dioic acid hydratase in catechol pathway